MLLAMPLSTIMLPPPHQAGWVAAVAAAHFVGQLLLNRGFNLDDATHGSALFTQQVLYSYVWSITILHGPIQLCAALGSACILAGVLFVTESSQIDEAEAMLEVQRTESTLFQRSLSARLAPLDLLAARIGLPPIWKEQPLRNEGTILTQARQRGLFRWATID
eukprot:GHRR01008463.1.p1 GENE.GHRR01008463.1~~GHRR01008463.1.p1  ORF type:complete len:163 (+),score=29.06 GHRR01008463.1:144-632(+)